MYIVENKPGGNGVSPPPQPGEKRTDEWSECPTLIGQNQDSAAFTRLFRHFAPLMRAFALSGSTLSANHADELVQEVMLKVWQTAGGFNPKKAAASCAGRLCDAAICNECWLKCSGVERCESRQRS